MLKFVVLAVSIGVLVLLVKNQMGRKAELAKKEKEKEATRNMVKDETCGTYVDENTNFKVKYYGKVYCFCSQKCLDEFKTEKMAG